MTIRERIQIKQLRDRRAGAFDAFYAEYGSRVYRFCLRLSCNPADAEDLAQDVFLGALSGIERFQERSSIATWLYRIAILRWRTVLSRTTGRDDLPLDDGVSSVAIGDPAAAAAERFDIERALGRLPESHRSAFVLVKAEGMTCPEAADVLQIPEGTVKYHVHEAIVAMRTYLSDPAAPSDAALFGEEAMPLASLPGRRLL